MTECTHQIHELEELTDEDKFRIMMTFSEEIVPKLRKLGARIGNVDCRFAGPQYRHWLVHFQSKKDGYQITEFEYDPNSDTLDLDL
jgi:hypothetical protein